MYKSARYNYPAQFGDRIDDLLATLRSTLLSGQYILSPAVTEFETRFAAYVGSRFARGVNSGTDALAIALLALGVGPGDEVITQANTFHATVAAIQWVGATPVLVDADEETYLMQLATVPQRATPQTRAVIPVHLFGKPTPMLDLLRWTAARQILVVEDAAQAHGAMIDGRRVGSFGQAGCFSFHPSKNLAAAGDAGAIVSDDADLVERLDRFRALGQAGQNEHVVVGMNSKLDAMQASVLSCKLALLDQWNAARSSIAATYRARLADLPVSFQQTDPGETHVFHLFQLRTPRRDELLQFLQSRGVDAVVRYPTPIHLQPAFARWGWRQGQFPVAERLAAELLCLPIRPDMEEAEVSLTCDTVRDFFSRRQ